MQSQGTTLQLLLPGFQPPPSSRELAAKHRATHTAGHQRWASKNLAHLAKYKREYLARKMQDPAWLAAYRERQQQSRVKHRDAAAENIRRWRKAHPEFSQRKGIKRRARQRNAPDNTLTRLEWLTLRAMYFDACAYCGARPKRLTIDHVIPLARGGANAIYNVVPACHLCNSTKSHREGWEPVRLPVAHGWYTLIDGSNQS